MRVGLMLMQQSRPMHEPRDAQSMYGLLTSDVRPCRPQGSSATWMTV